MTRINYPRVCNKIFPTRPNRLVIMSAKNIKLAIYMELSVQSPIHSTCHEIPPSWRDHIFNVRFIQVSQYQFHPVYCLLNTQYRDEHTLHSNEGSRSHSLLVSRTHLSVILSIDGNFSYHSSII